VISTGAGRYRRGKIEKDHEAVTTTSTGRPNSLNGKAFILATGSFVGGGLYATREAIIENVFNLPYTFLARAILVR